jgi:hypothetical protein
LLVIDHEKKYCKSIFEDTTENKLERDLENILKDENVQKEFSPESFQISADSDKEGRPIFKQIEGFPAQKYNVQTVYTMTKYKQNLVHFAKDLETMRELKSFDEYMALGQV